MGGFDADKFAGDKLSLGIGRPGEPYEGIGRGTLNIEGLPVYRDAEGGVVVLINGYDGDVNRVRATAEYLQDCLRRFCQSDGGTITMY